MPDNNDIPQFPLLVFYDGACSVCAREIEHYLQQDHGGRLRAVDISAADFDAESYHIPLARFMFELHAIDGAGTVYSGVNAFRAIWQAYPTLSVYRIMGRFISLPLINQVAKLCYRAFARIRPFLPKRKSNCSNGICRLK